MRGTLTIRGATVDLNDTAIAKLKDIETIREHLAAQDEALATQSTKDDMRALFDTINDLYAQVVVIRDMIIEIRSKPTLWQRVARFLLHKF